MRNHFKFQIILCINFLLLIPLNLKAQKEYTPKQNLKNHMENSLKFEKYSFTKLRFIANQQDGIQRKYHLPVFNRSRIIDDCPEQPGILSEVIPLTVNKKQLTEDVLDSVIYTKRGWKYKDYFTYDEKEKRLAYLKQYWDTTTTDWINDCRRTYTHDGSGNEITSIGEVWDSNAGIWVNAWRETYSYDGSGNRITYIDEDWDSNAGIWVNDFRETYTYDDSGNMRTYLHENWDSNAGIWINVLRGTFSCDDSGNLLTYIDEEWDSNAGIWVSNSRFTYTRDDSGKLLTYIAEEWDNNAGIWVNDWRCIYTYDGSGNNLTHLYEDWDSIAGIWVNDSRRTYTYDGSGNNLTYLHEIWDSIDWIWVNDCRRTLTYDGSGNKLTYLYEKWDSNDGIWANVLRATYSYDSSGNLIHFINEEWSGSGWFASVGSCGLHNNEYSYYYYCEELSAYYSPITDIDNVDNNVICSFSLSQNYPNPFNPSTTIKFTLPKSELTTLRVYNILGKEVSILVSKKLNQGNHIYTFDGNKLASGIYYYQLVAGEFQQVKKMILLR